MCMHIWSGNEDGQIGYRSGNLEILHLSQGSERGLVGTIHHQW